MHSSISHCVYPSLLFPSTKNKSLGLHHRSINSIHFRGPNKQDPRPEFESVITVTKNEAPKSKPLFTAADSGDLSPPSSPSLGPSSTLGFNYVLRGEGDLFHDPFS